MSDRPADLGAELRRIVADGSPGAGEHPPPEELIAYHRRTLPEARAEELRDHLAACAECTALLLDFDEHWSVGAAGETERADSPWHRRPGPAWAAAAGLAIALGLVAWFASHELERRTRVAGSGYQSENLDPEGSADRSGPHEQTVEVPEKADHVVLTLNAEEIRDPDTGAVYAATLRSADEVLGEAEGTLDEHGQFTLIVASRALRPGEYEVVLRGPPGAGTEQRYLFQVAERGAQP